MPAVRTEESAFASLDPRISLFRRSVLPIGQPIARLAIIHGYGDHGGRYADLMDFLAQRGVACHAVDLRGQGRATGARGYVNRWDEYLDDLRAFLALPPLQAQAPLFLLGHSHGGLIVAAAMIRNASGLPPVAGCILTAPFFASRMAVPRWKVWLGRLTNLIAPSLRLATGLRGQWLCADATLLADTAGDPLCVRTATPRWFVTHQVVQREVLDLAGVFHHPLLLLLGGADPIADNRAARDFFQKCGSTDKTIREYPDFLHEILRESGRERVFNDIIEWLHPRVS